MKGWSLLAVVAVASSSPTFLPAEETVSRPSPEPPVVLPAVIISEYVERRVIYESRVEVLWKGTRRTKSITYRDVLAAAYDTKKFDLDRCLEDKRRYRENVHRKHLFFCNYDAVSFPVAVEWQTSGKRLTNTTIMQGCGYDWQKKTVTVVFDAPDSALLHAAGASLAGHATGRSLNRMEDSIDQHRENYVARKIKFELCLQDFNRYYATLTGKPVSTPLEALRGLVMLGHKPDQKVVESIVRRYKLAYTGAQMAWALNAPSATRDGRRDTFEHAHRLVDGMAGMSFKDTQYGLMLKARRTEHGLNQLKDTHKGSYEQLLTDILIEAPGHI